MSEYQYYEFRAIDRPLTDREIRAVRRITTRAELTPTSFTNVYQWGDFKGDPLRMMEKYYDAFLYVANWGTHRFMLRLARRAVRLERFLPYRIKGALDIHEKGRHLIFEFGSEEDPEYDDDDGTGWMGSLIPLRENLARGDIRCLYLAWLSAVQGGMIRKSVTEPPVPPGLKNTSGPLKAFAEFMRVDKQLLRAAAEASGRIPVRCLQRASLQSWIRNLPEARRIALLLKWLESNDPFQRAEVLEAFERSTAPHRPQNARRSRKGMQSDPASIAEQRRRTAGELLSEAGIECPKTR
jgi:hypothetical protein